ncbi:MAG: GTP-binding protein [Verrucomicrobiota bacterium]
MSDKARYIMMGGFLGAGKTTSVLQLARHLHGRGLKVGLITNDQGAGLVDTATLGAHGFPVEEIAGGCFCCRFHSLKDAADTLTETTRPDVFIAEAVGSCTDLVATVSYPLRRIYGDRFTVAPLTVVLDPRRALRIFELEPGRKFSEKVLYIYRKQLEEARIILLNKIDIVDEDQRARLRTALSEACPEAEVLDVSARSGDGMNDWFDRVTSREQTGGEAMEIDYALYGEGEALLGWLNATLSFEAAEPVEGDAILLELSRSIQDRLEEEIAHLKMTLSPATGSGEIATINLVGNDFVPEATLTLSEPVNRGEVVLNLRAEAPPEALEAAVKAAMAEPTIAWTLDHVESFKPGQPEPVFRDAESS